MDSSSDECSGAKLSLHDITNCSNGGLTQECESTDIQIGILLSSLKDCKAEKDRMSESLQRSLSDQHHWKTEATRMKKTLKERDNTIITFRQQIERAKTAETRNTVLLREARDKCKRLENNKSINENSLEARINRLQHVNEGLRAKLTNRISSFDSNSSTQSQRDSKTSQRPQVNSIAQSRKQWGSRADSLYPMNASTLSLNSLDEPVTPHFFSNPKDNGNMDKVLLKTWKFYYDNLSQENTQLRKTLDSIKTSMQTIMEKLESGTDASTLNLECKLLYESLDNTMGNLLSRDISGSSTSLASSDDTPFRPKGPVKGSIPSWAEGFLTPTPKPYEGPLAMQQCCETGSAGSRDTDLSMNETVSIMSLDEPRFDGHIIAPNNENDNNSCN